jgi:protein SCO1/2
VSERVNDTQRPRRSLFRLALPALVLLALAGLLSFLLIGGSNKPTLPGGVQQTTAGHGFYGTLALPAKPAPPLQLRNYLGQQVNIDQFRGKAVLVTFLYTNCPDICPLITANLHNALEQLGASARRAQVIAVSVDPRGDTPSAVAHFLGEHQMVGRMQYLIGSSAALSRTWKAWGVGSEREAGQPQLVAHSALVYGIDASGRLRTVYPSSFEPRQIVHDVPLLAAQ